VTGVYTITGRRPHRSGVGPQLRIWAKPVAAVSARGWTASPEFTSGPLLNQPGALVGDTDRASRFDGTNDHVNVPDAASLDLGNGPLTLEAWIKLSTIDVDGAIVYKWAAYTLGMSGTTANRLTLRKPGTADIVSSTIAISDTTSWHHVVATKNGTASRLYIDGVDVTGTVTDQTLVNTVDALQISGSPRFAGSIDEVAVYNSVLSAAAVLDHYKAGTGTG
jgi:concanavalin A-like lectin/glucanase superfamily protein